MKIKVTKFVRLPRGLRDVCRCKVLISDETTGLIKTVVGAILRNTVNGRRIFIPRRNWPLVPGGDAGAQYAMKNHIEYAVGTAVFLYDIGESPLFEHSPPRH